MLLNSFLLTPLNYFDADISLESTNAILLNIPENPDDGYSFEDYGVSQHFTCIPEIPPAFEYPRMKLFDVDGQLQPPSSTETLSRNLELYHRIRV